MTDEELQSQLVDGSFNPLSLSSDAIASTNIVATSDDVSNTTEDSALMSIWVARGILLMVAVLWGTNFAAVKYLETLCFHPPCVHPPSEAALARFGLAGLVALPLLWKQNKDVIVAGFECGLFITLGYFTQAQALAYIPSGKCAFICSLTVVTVPVLSSVLGKGTVKLSNVVCAALALSGVGILEGLVQVPDLLGIGQAMAVDTIVPTTTAVEAVTTTTMNSAASTGWLASAAATMGVDKGDILALGQPLGFGLSFLRIEHYVEKFKDVDNQVMTLSAAQCVSVGLLSLLWVLYDFHGVVPDMSYMVEPHRIGAIAWTGIMTTVVAIYFQGKALQVASATEAALTFASEPVWASLFGAWLLHENLNSNSYVGGAVILAACVFGVLGDLGEGEVNSAVATVEDVVIDVKNNDLGP